jgi:hypothetical protein
MKVELRVLLTKSKQYLEFETDSVLLFTCIHYFYFIIEAVVSKLSANHLSEYMQSKYDVYSRTLNEFKVPDMASQYTNAIYNARDQIASRMNGPVLKTIKQVGDNSYQLVRKI